MALGRSHLAPVSDSGRRSAVGRRQWLLVLTLLLAFALRVHRIGEQRVWWDEGWSVWVARFSASGILRQTGNDVHPPLYFELLHLWRGLSGDSEAGLRLLSAFLGALTVAATFALGRSMAGGLLRTRAAWWVGSLAALFLTVSRFAIAWSQEIRMYALATLLAVLAVWAARRYWARGRWRDAAAYVLATAAGLYTLYLFAPVWAALNVAWLAGLLPHRKSFLSSPLPQGERALPRSPAPLLPRAWWWIALQFIILALFAPWALYAAGGFLSTAAATPIRLLDFLHIYWTVLTVGIPLDVAQFNWLTLPALAVFVAAVGALVKRTADGGRQTIDRRPLTTDHRAESASSDADGQTEAHLRMRTLQADGISPPATRHSPLSSLLFSRPPAPLRDVTLLLAVLLLPALLVYLISLPKQNFYNPPFNPRYLVIFTPFYSVLVAWGVVVLGGWLSSSRRETIDDRPQTTTRKEAVVRRPSPVVASELVARRSSLVTLALSAFMLAVALVGLWPYYPGRVRVDDYPSLTSTIDAYRQPGDATILYSDTDWPIFAYHHPDPWRGVPHLWTVTPQVAADYLAPIWDGHDAVWLVTTPYSAGTDPQRAIPAWLEERAAAVRTFTYKDLGLTLYARTAERAATADALAPNAPPPAPLDVPLATGRVTGYARAAHDFKSGDVIHLFLYYNTGGGASSAGLIDGAGNVWGETAVNLPTTDATARQQVDLRVPPEAPDGRYRFFVRDAGGQPAPFGRLTIRQKRAELLTEAEVTIPNRLDAPFDQGVRLLGYNVAATAVPGETLALTLYWSSAGGVAQPYKVFTHLLGDTFNAASGNFLWGQSDAEPAANTRPTTTWRDGEVIVDEHAIPVAADAPPGTYRLEVGLYDPVSGARLAVLGPTGAAAGDHVIVTAVEVTP